MPVGGKPLTLTLVAQSSQNRLAAPLPFIVQAVKCDNYTGQWLWLSEANDFIPPYYTDRIIVLPEVSSLTVIAQAPPGYTQAAPVAGQQANFTPYSDFVMPASGVFQPPGSAAPSEGPMGLGVISSSGAAVTKTIPMPLYGLGLVFQASSSGASTFGVQLSGGGGDVLTPTLIDQRQDNADLQTQLHYQLLASDLVPPSSTPWVGPNAVDQAATGLILSVTGGGVTHPTAYLYYWALGPSSMVWNFPDRPLSMQGVAGGVPLPVTPTPESIPGIQSALINTGPGPGTTATLIAGVAGQVITVYSIQFTIDPGGTSVAGFYQIIMRGGTSGRPVAAGQLHLLASGPASVAILGAIPPSGIALNAGEALVAAAQAGNASNVDCTGVLSYTQA